jgi:hypothetical protein
VSARALLRIFPITSATDNHRDHKAFFIFRYLPAQRSDNLRPMIILALAVIVFIVIVFLVFNGMWLFGTDANFTRVIFIHRSFLSFFFLN